MRKCSAGPLAVVALATASVAPVGATTPGEAPPLAPHRAIYDFTLARSSAGSVSEMSGRMVYELTGSPCDGYTQTMRFVTRSTSQDGTVAVNDMRSTSFEEADGKRLRFTFNQFRDDKLAETTSGDARRASEGVKIELDQPARKQLAIGGDALFPIQHSLRLLDAARASQALFQSDLYDGSDKGEKVYSTTAVIGPTRAKGHNATLARVDNAERLDTFRSWPVSLSYFEPGGQTSDAVPSYELSFLFFENGVVRRMTLDYGDFALKGDLKSITFHEASRCDKK